MRARPAFLQFKVYISCRVLNAKWYLQIETAAGHKRNEVFQISQSLFSDTTRKHYLLARRCFQSILKPKSDDWNIDSNLFTSIRPSTRHILVRTSEIGYIFAEVIGISCGFQQFSTDIEWGRRTLSDCFRPWLEHLYQCILALNCY